MSVAFFIDILIVFFLYFISTALGLKVFNLLKISFDYKSQKIFVSIGTGFLILSYFILMLSLINSVSREILYVFFIFVVILCFAEIKYLIKELLRFKSYLPNYYTLNNFEKILFLMVTLAMVSNIFYCYAPPNQIREMMYDLSIPTLFIRNFKISKYIDYLPFYYFFYFYYQMFYTICMLMFEKGLSFKLFNYFLGILNFLLIYKFTEKKLNKKIALLSASIYYLMPLTVSNSGTANVEFGLIFYGMLAFWCILEWFSNKKDIYWLLLSAIFSGVSFAIKLPGFATIIAIAIFIFLGEIFVLKNKFGKIFYYLLLFCVVSFVSFFPWIVRNYILTYNPFYPFSYFETGGAPDCINEIVIFSNSKNKYNFIEYLEMHRNFHSGDIDQSGGPFIFPLLVVAILLYNFLQNKERVILVFGLIYFFVLYFVLPFPLSRFEFRYYMFGYSIFAIISSFTIDKLLNIFVKGEKIIKFTVIFSLIFPGLIMSLYFGAKRVPLFLGMQNRDEYISERFKEYSIVKFANLHLSKEDKIVLVGSPSPGQYYWNPYVFVVPHPLLMKKVAPSEVIDKFKSDGITHILFYKEWRESCKMFYDSLHLYSRENLKIIYDKDNFLLCKID